MLSKREQTIFNTSTTPKSTYRNIIENALTTTGFDIEGGDVPQAQNDDDTFCIGLIRQSPSPHTN